MLQTACLILGVAVVLLVVAVAQFVLQVACLILVVVVCVLLLLVACLILVVVAVVVCVVLLVAAAVAVVVCVLLLAMVLLVTEALLAVVLVLVVAVVAAATVAVAENRAGRQSIPVRLQRPLLLLLSPRSHGVLNDVASAALHRKPPTTTRAHCTLATMPTSGATTLVSQTCGGVCVRQCTTLSCRSLTLAVTVSFVA